MVAVAPDTRRKSLRTPGKALESKTPKGRRSSLRPDTPNVRRSSVAAGQRQTANKRLSRVAEVDARKSVARKSIVEPRKSVARKSIVEPRKSIARKSVVEPRKSVARKSLMATPAKRKSMAKIESGIRTSPRLDLLRKSAPRTGPRKSAIPAPRKSIRKSTTAGIPAPRKSAVATRKSTAGRKSTAKSVAGRKSVATGRKSTRGRKSALPKQSPEAKSARDSIASMASAVSIEPPKRKRNSTLNKKLMARTRKSLPDEAPEYDLFAEEESKPLPRMSMYERKRAAKEQAALRKAQEEAHAAIDAEIVKPVKATKAKAKAKGRPKKKAMKTKKR